AAVVVLLLAAIALPNFSKARTTSARNAIINNLRQIDGAKQQWALENHKSANDEPTMKDLVPYLRGGLPPVAGEKYVVGKVGESVAADLETGRAKSWFGGSELKPGSRGVDYRRIRLPEEPQLALADKNSPLEAGRVQVSGQVVTMRNQDAASLAASADRSGN